MWVGKPHKQGRDAPIAGGVDKMLQGLQFVMTHVPDVAAARDFYKDTLGFEVETEMPGFVQFKPSTHGGAAFALGQEDQGDPVELWWYVDDADATHAELVGKGVEIVESPHDMPFGRVFSIKGPDGGTLYMLQPAR